MNSTQIAMTRANISKYFIKLQLKQILQNFSFTPVILLYIHIDCKVRHGDSQEKVSEVPSLGSFLIQFSDMTWSLELREQREMKLGVRRSHQTCMLCPVLDWQWCHLCVQQIRLQLLSFSRVVRTASWRAETYSVFPMLVSQSRSCLTLGVYI